METNSPPRVDHTRAIAWIASATVALAALGLVAFLKSCQTGDQAVHLGEKAVAVAKTAVEELPNIAAKFKTGTISHTFVEQNTEISATMGDILEVATIQSTESFIHQDTKRVLWDSINLGTTTSEIRCPVTFRYHIRLSDPWRLATRDHICLVLAPAVRPSQPPAIHTDRLEKQTNEDWLRFNGEENLQALERGITPELASRAGDRSHQALVREASRQAVAEFVKHWLLTQDFWREDRFSAVVVVFPNEAGFATDEALAAYQEREPTLTLQKKN